MPYTTPRGHWHDTALLNMHAPTENKSDDTKDNPDEQPELVSDQFPKHDMKTLLQDFSAKVGREDTLISTIMNENLHKISNDWG
jgi:hypothetical protein